MKNSSLFQQKMDFPSQGNFPFERSIKSFTKVTKNKKSKIHNKKELLTEKGFVSQFFSFSHLICENAPPGRSKIKYHINNESFRVQDSGSFGLYYLFTTRNLSTLF